jgi:hypothetical protein
MPMGDWRVMCGITYDPSALHPISAVYLFNGWWGIYIPPTW